MNEATELVLSGDISEVERLGEWVTAFCARLQAPAKVCFDINLALEELVVNAIQHGACSAEAGAIRVGLAAQGNELVATVSDDGTAFDPTRLEAPDLNVELEERSVGGLGIHLVRQLTDSLAYERRDNRNCLTFRKALGKGT